MLLITIILLLLMLTYLRLARRVGIIDKPNKRSSHSRITVRGGGVIFPIAVVLWSVWNGLSSPVFLIGLFLISVISFLDDVYSIDYRLRLIVHFIAVLFLSFAINIIDKNFHWLLIFSLLMIGWINASNFMDGINGMTSFCSMAVIIPVYILNEESRIINKDLIIIVGIALVIFSFFNARRNALCFAGDVGSVSLAFILGYFVSELIIHTGNWIYILFLSVYGVDSVLTILHRLLQGEKITEAHRNHLYQFLANEAEIGHVKVAMAYALLQLAISGMVIEIGDRISPIILITSVISMMIVVYILMKRLIIRRKLKGV